VASEKQNKGVDILRRAQDDAKELETAELRGKREALRYTGGSEGANKMAFRQEKRRAQNDSLRR
jgi:hypothetical protein